VNPDLISKNPQKMLLLCTLRGEVLVYTVQPFLKIFQTHFAKQSAKNRRVYNYMHLRVTFDVCYDRYDVVYYNLNNVFARYDEDIGRI
jgi:hypothetical protein